MEENKITAITKEKTDVLNDYNKQMAAIKFLLFLEWNNALYVNGEKRISDIMDRVRWHGNIEVMFKT